MSTIETILTRMMNEPTFAEAVLTNTEKALVEYNLSAEKIAKFKALSRAQFDVYTPEERKSFSRTSGSYGETFVYVRDEGG